ncbi:MAG: glycoside hydrolase family 2 protein, partial [Lachnospiraceae bacterium]|nr:glycoside hydrolase family 2 protein [Lachnospiraceae bacterium]
VIDYMTYGGIYRDVYFDVTDKRYLQDVFLYSDIDFKEGTITLRDDVTLSDAAAKDRENLELRVYMDDVLKCKAPLAGDTKDFAPVSFDLSMNDTVLWSPDTPKLYKIETRLMDKEGNTLDAHFFDFGFRHIEFKKDGFYLNGEKTKIRGLNRHQSYPYVGYAMPASMQIMDANVLKYELGLNAVRTSHYPQSHDFIKRCDEVGLLVFTEIPGWQHIGDDEWKKLAVENVSDMVSQYRNHPSIILWGVRINESPDDDSFYEATNKAAHSLDKTRPTGGVRCIKNSNLLEDVYTYNDFSYDGTGRGCDKKKAVTSDMNKAYLISEYNGHMFPTKNYDTEEHRREHALRHATVLNAVAGEEDIAGSFGWCMADYNTHKDFGSGDRICYHGVLDMFRNRKPAAFIYKAQADRDVVLELSSTMDIGEHPACNRGDTWIYTNADSVRMYKNNRFIKEYTKDESPFKNLSSGPIRLDDFIGDAIEIGEKGSKGYKKDLKEALNLVAVHGLNHPPKRLYVLAAKLLLRGMNLSKATPLYNKYVGDWGAKATEYKFEAVKNGTVLKTLIKKPVTKLYLEALPERRTPLKEGRTYDVSCIRIRAVDEFKNLSFFYNEPIRISVSGNLKLIGPSVISLKGGMGGTYVRTDGEGEGRVTLTAAGIDPVTINFKIEKENTQKI